MDRRLLAAFALRLIERLAADRGAVSGWRPSPGERVAVG
jgi:hypothetical protein